MTRLLHRLFEYAPRLGLRVVRVLAAAALVGQVWGAQPAVTPETPSPRAPDFTLPKVGGGTLQLSAHRGKVRVLFFVREMGRYVPEVLEMIERVVGSSRDYEGQMLICIIGVRGDTSHVDTLRGRFRLHWTVLEDADLVVHHAYKVIAVPTVVLVDREDRIRARLAGYSFAFGNGFRTALRDCLGLPSLAEHSDATTATKRSRRYAALGDAMVRREIWSSARRSYQQALDIDPEMHAARLGLAFCHLRDRRPNEATLEFQRLLAIDVLTTPARVGVAWANVLEGKLTQARADLEVLRPAASNLPEYFEAWAAFYEAAGSKNDAEQARQNVRKLRGPRVIAPVTRPKLSQDGSK